MKAPTMEELNSLVDSLETSREMARAAQQEAGITWDTVDQEERRRVIELLRNYPLPGCRFPEFIQIGEIWHREEEGATELVGYSLLNAGGEDDAPALLDIYEVDPDILAFLRELVRLYNCGERE